MEDDEKQQQEQELQQEIIQKKEKLDKALSDLKAQHGIGGIHERTHIAIFKIEAILNKDYEQFDRTTAIGFIRILEREYHLNLSAWIEDYDDYCQAHGLLKTDEYDTTFTDVNVKIDHYEKHASPKWLNIAIGIIVLLVIGGYLAFNYLDESPLKLAETNTTQTPPTDDENLTESDEYEGETNATASETTETNTTTKPETNTTKPTAAPKETNTTAAATTTIPKETNATTTPQRTTNTETNATNPTQTLTFNVGDEVAGRQLWVGVLYVNTKRRVHQIVTNELNLKVSEPMLFVTGHGRFSVGIDGDLQKLNHPAPLYLYFAPNEGVRVVTEAEFREINGGRGW